MAVDPILASSLWPNDFPSGPPDSPYERRKLATGCPSIDSSLNGGFDYGSISCLSAEADSGGKELSYALIASHLLCSDHYQATIVDTANSFDVRRLHKRITIGLQETACGDDVKAEAVKVLERVRIMKAFDFVGMTECVAELREGLEARGKAGSPQAPVFGKAEVRAPRGTVGDSEDEDDMLDGPDLTEEPAAPDNKSDGKDTQETKQDHQHLLIIDNITSVTSPVIKNSHIQGQALLTTFMRSLAHLTQTHEICTIVHNAAATYSNNPTTSSTPSIFSSCTLVPALGKTFAYSLDLHLLLHRMPLTAADAKTVYSAHKAIPKSNERMASVLEVLQDRHSDRVGHWSAFKPDAEGRLAAIATA